MRLVQDQNSGVWTNPDWTPETAGTFALVIGVSRYSYLKDGEGDGHGGNLAPDNYDLGQLTVSALTATRFFEWLRDHYRVEGAPLAKCWLLLAPTDAEATAYGAPFPQSAEPTLAACQQAIWEWYAAARDLPARAAEQSRVVFFFSGHGVAVTHDRQILLPCDYLRPPAHAASQAISTTNISIGMAALAPQHQFFFIDACRNDLERLRETENLTGTNILDEKRPGLLNPALVGPIFYAAGAGSLAWSPMSPADGISYFGQAVLEALQAKAQFQPDCDGQSCRIMANKLGNFLRSRVANLIPVRGAEAYVRMGGIVVDGVITELPPNLAVQGQGPPGRPEPVVDAVELPSDWQPAAGTFDQAWNVLQSEFASSLLTNGQAVPLGAGRGNAPAKPTIHHLHRTADRDLYRMELSVAPGAHWLLFVDPLRDRTCACVLPGDAGESPCYLLEWRREIREHVSYLTRLEAKLSPSNEGALKEAAALWELYQAIDLMGALKSGDLQKLERRLQEKVDSPLGAVIAGTILLRLRAHNRLGKWLANLTDWFADIPDGPVLYAEQLLHTKGDAIRSAEFLKLVLQLRTRGLPYTSEAFGYADQHVRRLLQVPSLRDADREELEMLRNRIDTALRYFRSGGLFAVFVGDSSAVTADLIAPQLGGGASPASANQFAEADAGRAS